MDKIFSIDSSKESWLQEVLSKLSLDEVSDFFEYAAVCLGSHFAIDSFDSRRNICFRINRIERSLFYSFELENLLERYRNPSKFLKFRLELDRIDSEMHFLMEKTGILFYLIRSKARRKQLLTEWFYDMSCLEELRNFYSSNKRDRFKFLKSVCFEAKRHLDWWLSKRKA